ncbi:MAG: M56 family metallopeptidase [Bacteroidota bacterium]
MMDYLLHVSILVGGAYLFYRLFLEKETYFQLNRWILLGGMVLIFALPLWEIPAEWSLRPHWERRMDRSTALSRISSPESLADGSARLGEGLGKKPLSSPVELSNTHSKAETTLIPTAGDNPSSSLPESGALRQLDHPASPTPGTAASAPAGVWSRLRSYLPYVYLLGLAIFGLNFLIQLLALLFRFYHQPAQQKGDLLIVETHKDSAPYSFWNRVFINPHKYDEPTLRQIIQHESIHIREKHSLDILLAELLTLLLWFNPFAWLYRRAVENNLEFLTDQKMLRRGNDPQTYQMSLLRVAVPELSLSLTNNYNQSFLKKRILMMNTRQSSLRSAWKYLCILPVLGLSVMSLNAVKYSQLRLSQFAIDLDQPRDTQEPQLLDADTVNLTVASPEADHGRTRALGDTASEATSYEFRYDYPTPPLDVTGKWAATLQATELCFQFVNDLNERGYRWNRHDCYARDRFGVLPQGQEGTFELRGEAGTIEFRGKFTGPEGIGHYTFRQSEDFLRAMAARGYTELKEDLLFHMVLADIGTDYLAGVERLGYSVDDQMLESLAYIGIKLDYLQTMKQKLEGLGYRDISLDRLIEFNIHEIDMAYVAELRQLGFDKLSLSNIVEANIHDLSLEYMNELKTVGLDELPFDELLAFAIHEVKPEDVQRLRQMGFRDLTHEEILQASIHEVTPAYFESLQAEGLDNLEFQDLIAFAIHDIDPTQIRELRGLGFRDLSKEEILEAGIHDVDASYFKELQTVGLKDLSIQDITEFAIHDIRPQQIVAIRDMGFSDLSKEEILAAGIHDVSPRYIQQVRQMGFTDLSLEEVVEFAIHDVAPQLLVDLREMGFENLSREQLLQAAIHDVNPRFLRELQAQGLTDISFSEAVEFSIHDIDPTQIRELRDLGYQLDKQQILAAGIHGVSARGIRELRELGYADIPIDLAIELQIHGVDAAHIRQQRNRGKQGLSLREHLSLKIMGND